MAIDAKSSICSEFADARVIVLSTFAGDVEIQRALEAGARAYLLKSMPLKELVDVICQVHAGRKRIPPEIAAHLAEDYIAEGLVDPRSRFSSRLPAAKGTAISPNSSSSPRKQKVHIKHSREKLGASDRTQAVASGVRRGIIQL